MTPTTTPAPTIDAADLTPGSVISYGTLRSDHLADALLGEIDRLALSRYLPADLAADAQLLAASASDLVAGDLPTNDVETIADLFEFLTKPHLLAGVSNRSKVTAASSAGGLSP